MADTNKSLRIKTNINTDSFVNVNLNQTYDTFEILSLKMRSEDVYRLHSANYGVIIGRVLANENFGVPNAKISVFIESEFDDETISSLYPYTTTSTKKDNVRYNLLPDNKQNDCHQIVGTFPNKTYLLDNDALIEVFDKYYVYTTRTNNAGDYIIMGVPVGQHTIHMDLDLSDCGILSQRPRDFVYKGYTIEQFENPNQFKTSAELDTLTQIFSQNQSVNVIPFWGNADNGETIGITRADINIAFKFEPTCVFMGSLVADNASNGISKKCVPTNQMGAMDELTTGEGTIEMIRKTPGGNIEEFQVKGTELIDGNGIWCYQIPMNLDYMMTDEYGNMVPTDDPTKGVPTRARVRFRISMEDAEANTDNYFRAKVLVPHNPLDRIGGGHEDYDYEFGSNTREDSFRDLFWNNVYTVKSYIPRFQKPRNNVKTERFSGIKHCNIYGQNNPMPYNNIRIKLPLMFTILCALIKTYIRVVAFLNKVLYWILRILVGVAGKKNGEKLVKNAQYILLADGLCPDLENWYFAPGANTVKKFEKNGVPDSADIPVPDGIFNFFGNANNNIYLLEQTFNIITEQKTDTVTGRRDSKGVVHQKEEGVLEETNDESSIDYVNQDDNDTGVCLTVNVDYLVSCIEMALAQEYKVINFDFYNDWINGVIYMPRWMRIVRKKRSFLWGLIKIKPKIKGCMDDTSIFNKTRYYTQQCALWYAKDENGIYNKITTPNGCDKTTGEQENKKFGKQKCHKVTGRKIYPIFGGNKKTGQGNGGVVHEHETMLKENVYYFKPCEWGQNNRRTLLFANDIVLLGSLNDCSMYGIPQAFKYLRSSTYIMPTNLALTNMDEDGYLYATPDGTICNGTEKSNFLEGSGVTQVTPSFSGEVSYYKGSSTPMEFGISPNGSDIVDIFDDSIPLTEAAGISWNYTGPGQGEKSENVNTSLYMPGGHFLGISCFNSETNIKSCINLQRVCEMGSNISQRREEIREIIMEDENGEEYKVKYRYFVPTGLISNDDINGEDFRTMFATMNCRRLLCEDNFVDEKTGYPFYRFNYLRNTGFGGELKSTIEQDTFGAWNTKLTVEDEYSNLGGKIAKDIHYDDEETGETYTRTWETANYDYYSFRFGLMDLSEEEQARHYLLWTNSNGGVNITSYSGGGRRSSSGMYQTTVDTIENGGKSVALPQYENSFYFYFGLRDGATAFDEFNKQFFSNCETETTVTKNLTLAVHSEFDACKMISTATISGKDAVNPVTLTYEYYGENGEYSAQTIENIEVTNGYYSIDIEGLPKGTYIFKVVDGDGNTAQRKVELGGNNDVDALIDTQSFTFDVPSGMSASDVSKSGETFDCGYISISNVSFNGNYYSGTPMVTIVDSEGKYWTNSNCSDQPGSVQLTNITTATSIYDKYGDETEHDITDEEGTLLVFVWSADTDYSIYLWNAECDCNDTTSYYYGTYNVGGVSNVDLYLGNKEYNYGYKDYLSTGNFIQHIDSDGKCWWDEIGDDSDADNWYLRYFLMKRSASGDPYTNNVFGMNENKVIINTALFGQAEKYDTTTNNYVVTDTTGYEYDGRLNGVVSDTTYNSTWPTIPPFSSDYSPAYRRRLFGEMVVNGNTVGSQPFTTIRMSETQEYYTSGNVHGFDVTDRNNMLPDSELEDYIVINASNNDKYGYFIGKADNGTLYYLTLEYNYIGNERLFIYQGNKISGSILTLYPVFYYPVMHKEFKANVAILDWLNPKIIPGDSNASVLSDFNVRYEDESYAGGLYAENGLTYNLTLGKFVLNSNETYPRQAFPSRVSSGATDIAEEAICRCAFTPVIDRYLPLTHYDFIITENKPSTMGFEPELITIQGNVEATMAGYISYRTNGNTEEPRAYYYIDIIDVENNYYLMNINDTPHPLKPKSYIIYPPQYGDAATIQILGRFGANTDTSLNVIKEPGTFVQKPGEYVLITVTDSGLTFPYKVNNTTSETISKTIDLTNANLLAKNFDSSIQSALSGFDITLENRYEWDSYSGETNPIAVNDYVNDVLAYIESVSGQNRIPDFGNGAYALPNDETYVVCVVEGTNSTMVRIYPKLICLDEYSSNASEPYLILIPSGTTGVYN